MNSCSYITATRSLRVNLSLGYTQCTPFDTKGECLQCGLPETLGLGTCSNLHLSLEQVCSIQR